MATAVKKSTAKAAAATQKGSENTANETEVTVGETVKATTRSGDSRKPSTRKSAAVSGILSEEEVLKMSEKDYMNKAQLEFFRARLLTMKEEILANARETGEHLKENEVFADPNDRATVEEENMLEQRVRDRERKLLKKIDSALRRIDDGDYGFCLETGEPIGIPRLLARPTAELSIEAQEKHERLERLFAD